jgi:peptide/nickel transport system ATP-binding protein
VQFRHGLDRFDAVRGANVYIRSGEVVGIVGESGSGKTTLARVLVGLQPPTSGEIYLEGQRIFGPENNRRALPRSERWKLQMIFQDPYSSLNPRMRVWQAVAEAVHVWQRLSGAEAKAESLRLLNTMGIGAEQAMHFPKALSGGQRQRISVARALAPKPKVLIADEPTSAIDQSAQAQLLTLLQELQRERSLSVIFISHNMGLVRYMTTRVYVMKQAQIVESGDTEAVFENPTHPYTKLLLDSVLSRRAV